MTILVLNSGSSSQKICLFDLGDTLPDDPPVCLWDARVEWEDGGATFAANTLNGTTRRGRVEIASRPKAVEHLLKELWSGEQHVLSSASEIDVAGHRIVHGGPEYEQPVVITPEVKSRIARASRFAPLHNRAELEGVEIIGKLLGPIPQVAVFDTGFHRSMPLSAAIYPGPYEWWDEGIRRYGFHGINHQYCASRAAQLLGRDIQTLKLVTCHLGNGCSLAAILQGRSIDTTMGFTPLEGLMMGTRSGSVDPGILTYLMSQNHMDGAQIDDLLNHKSGLLGISGVSSDMRQVLAAIQQGSARAKLAFDIYIHRLQAGIGAMIAALGGIDALVFTGGVGENSSAVRSSACSKLDYLGLKLNEERNAKPSPEEDIAAPESRVRVLVIQAQEDWSIARECWKLIPAQYKRQS
jgi:acetate kinase